MGSPVAQMIRICLQYRRPGFKTWVQSLVWEDLMEKGMATHSSILVWRIPWTKEPGRSIGLQRIGHDWVTNTDTDRR